MESDLKSEDSHVKKVAKTIVFSICLLLVSPAIVAVWVEKATSASKLLFSFFSQLFALVPGHPGFYIRAAYYFAVLQRCAMDTHIGFGSVFVDRNVEVSSGFSTGSFCVFGHVNIGEGVRCASRVSIPSGKRQHLDDLGRLADVTILERVSIGRNCWLGEGAIIMADVGDASIVSAGSIVIESMPSHSIIGGNPAKVIKSVESAPGEQDAG